MKTIKKLNDEIMKITTTIHEKYPELENSLGELTDTIPDEKNPHITRKSLNDYRDTLATMINNYETFEKKNKTRFDILKQNGKTKNEK